MPILIINGERMFAENITLTCDYNNNVEYIFDNLIKGNAMSDNTSSYEFKYFYGQEIKKPYVEDYVPKQVIFNNRTTVVIWKDNSKTIVRVAEGEKFSEEIGLAEAIVKKLYGGNRSKFLRLVEGAYRQPEPKKK